MTYKSFLFKALYFTVWAGSGVLDPYLPVWFESLQFRKSQIGCLTMIPNIAQFFVAPLWTALSDSMHWRQPIMIGTSIASVLATLSMLLQPSFIYQAATMSLVSFFRAPTKPMIDALALAMIDNPAQYGPQRLWGAISFGIFSFIGGWTSSNAETTGDAPSSRFYSNFYIFAFFYFISIFAVIAVEISNSGVKRKTSMDIKPDIPLDDDDVSNTSQKHVDMQERSQSGTHASSVKGSGNMCSDLFGIITANPSAILFMTIILLSGVGQGVIDSFLFIRLRQLGGSGVVMGIARAITCAAQVPVFQFGGYLQRKFGTWCLLTVTQAAYVVRFAYYSSLTSPWAVLPCQCLDGLTYAATWNVACNYSNAISTERTKSTLLALMEGLHFGVGAGMGSLIGGLVYDHVGAVKLFEYMVILTAISSLLAGVGWTTVKDVVYLPEEGCEEDSGGNDSGFKAMSFSSLLSRIHAATSSKHKRAKSRLTKWVSRRKAYELVDTCIDDEDGDDIELPSDGADSSGNGSSSSKTRKMQKKKKTNSRRTKWVGPRKSYELVDVDDDDDDDDDDGSDGIEDTDIEKTAPCSEPPHELPKIPSDTDIGGRVREP